MRLVVAIAIAFAASSAKAEPLADVLAEFDNRPFAAEGVVFYFRSSPERLKFSDTNKSQFDVETAIPVADLNHFENQCLFSSRPNDNGCPAAISGTLRVVGGNFQLYVTDIEWLPE